MVEFQN